jgi:Kef-type K+ transport system membrane component KefB
MRRLLALLLVLLVAYGVGVYGGADQHALRSTGLALGFALIAAALAGALLERLRLPRITGYLLFGMVCGPYLANIITRPMARELQLFNGLAIALIAFIAGLEMNFARLRPRLAGIARLGAALLLTMFAGLFVLFWVTWPWLPLAPEATGLARVALVTILTIVTVSFSPTVTIAVIAESRARGPLSETVMAVVVLGDLVLILLFSFGMQFVRWATGDAIGPADVGLAIRLAWEIFGSFAFGAAIGALFAFYLRFVGRELTLVLLALCVLLSEVGARLHFEPLLAALAAGLVVENVAPPRGDALKAAVERGALPVLIIFFAAAGASLQLDALATLGGVALAVSLVRLFLIRAGTEIGGRRSGLNPAVGNLVWTGLVSQAGVTLGLAILVASEFLAWGIGLQTLVVALIALHELIGPVLFRAGLVRAGEVGRIGVHDHAGPAVPLRR